MATKKPSAKKVSAKASVKPAKLYKPIIPLYAVPIYGAAKSGDAAAMKKVAAQARKHISEVTSALAALEKKMGSARK
jgi:uncharacterized protein DUF1843